MTGEAMESGRKTLGQLPADIIHICFTHSYKDILEYLTPE